MTALMVASEHGQATVVEKLLEHGAQTDLRNEVIDLTLVSSKAISAL